MSFEYLGVKKNRGLVNLIKEWNELISKVYKNGNFLHWNVPQKEYVIDKPLLYKGFQWASRKQSLFNVRHENNGESECHFSSHSIP